MVDVQGNRRAPHLAVGQAASLVATGRSVIPPTAQLLHRKTLELVCDLKRYNVYVYSLMRVRRIALLEFDPTSAGSRLQKPSQQPVQIQRDRALLGFVLLVAALTPSLVLAWDAGESQNISPSVGNAILQAPRRLHHCSALHAGLSESMFAV
jgi:hypothetical protein